MLRCESKRKVWRCLFCGHRTEVNGHAPRATRYQPLRWFTEITRRRHVINYYYFANGAS